MKKSLIISLIAMIAMLMMVTTSFAYTVSVNLVNGTTQTTAALTGYATTGAMMDGMNVTATFTDGSTETVAWADTNYNSGAAAGASWTLSESGDTYGGNWYLSSSATLGITQLYIDAGTGDTVFDTYFGGAYGTAGSARGITFSVNSATNIDIVANYIDTVALTAAAPVGDLFRYLEINFTNQGGFTANDSLSFDADTDNLKFAGDIQPGVPEPGTMLLLGTGLFSLIGFRRRD